jgi:hypothetical protein
MGSLLIFTGSGDVEGGGVLLDTAKWGRPLEKEHLHIKVLIKWTPPTVKPEKILQLLHYLHLHFCK